MNSSDDGILDRDTHLRDTIDLLRDVVAVGMFSVDMSTGLLRASPGLLEIWASPIATSRCDTTICSKASTRMTV